MDWYCEGGRWSGSIKTKSGRLTDEAVVKDIDFSRDEEEYKKLSTFGITMSKAMTRRTNMIASIGKNITRNITSLLRTMPILWQTFQQELSSLQTESGMRLARWGGLECHLRTPKRVWTGMRITKKGLSTPLKRVGF